MYDIILLLVIIKKNMKNFKFNIDYKTSTIVLGAVVVLGIICCAVCCAVRYSHMKGGSQKMHYSFKYRDSDGRSMVKSVQQVTLIII